MKETNVSWVKEGGVFKDDSELTCNRLEESMMFNVSRMFRRLGYKKFSFNE